MTRSPFEWFNREFAPLFERVFPVFPFEARMEPLWGFKMEERENEYVLRAEVPGFEASELEVTTVGDVLKVRAVHPPSEKEPASEHPYARLERSVTLPPGCKMEAIEARYRNGVLEVHIPRAPEVRPRRIEVKT